MLTYDIFNLLTLPDLNITTHKTNTQSHSQ